MQETHWKILLSTALMAISLNATSAETIEDGYAAFKRGNYAAALGILTPLAEQGTPRAQFNLAYMHYVLQDYKAVAKWYRAAAEQGSANAQFILGIMHFNGNGVPHDYVQAHLWHNLAVAHGHETAKENRDEVAMKMNPAKIAEAEKLAREWMANQGL